MFAMTDLIADFDDELKAAMGASTRDAGVVVREKPFLGHLVLRGNAQDDACVPVSSACWVYGGTDEVAASIRGGAIVSPGNGDDGVQVGMERSEAVGKHRQKVEKRGAKRHGKSGSRSGHGDEKSSDTRN